MCPTTWMDTGVERQEEYQLAAADACVVLDTSAGPAAEVAYFSRSPLKYKLIVFTHERHKGTESFPAKRVGLRLFCFARPLLLGMYVPKIRPPRFVAKSPRGFLLATLITR